MIAGIEALAVSGRVLLDGELVAGAGRASDFYALAPRLAGAPRRPAALSPSGPSTCCGSTETSSSTGPTQSGGKRSSSFPWLDHAESSPAIPVPTPRTSSQRAWTMTSKESSSSGWPPGTALASAAGFGARSRPPAGRPCTPSGVGPNSVRQNQPCSQPPSEVPGIVLSRPDPAFGDTRPEANTERFGKAASAHRTERERRHFLSVVTRRRRTRRRCPGHRSSGRRGSGGLGPRRCGGGASRCGPSRCPRPGRAA